jgi:capsular exopolysaccharide synthesis family protein
MELKTYIVILWRRKWFALITFLFVLVIALFVGSRLPTSYTATTKLRIMTPLVGSPSYLDYNIYYANRLMNTYSTLATSNPVMEELKSKLNLTHAPKITTSIIADSELIQISAEESDAVLAANVANKLAEILIIHSNQDGSTEIPSGNTALSTRLSKVGDELDQARKDYETLIIPVSQATARLNKMNQNVAFLQQLYLTLQEQYEQTLVTENALTESNLPHAQASATHKFLGDRLVELEKELEQAKTGVETVEAQSIADNERLSTARSLLQQKEQQYADLAMQNDQAQAAGSMRAMTTTLYIADPAVPPLAPSSPGKVLIIAIGLMASFLCSVFVAFLVDNLDTTIFTPARIEKVTGITEEKIVPVSTSDSRPIQEENTDDVQTAVKNLNANLFNSNHLQSLKSIAITDIESGEKKSSIIVSFAKTLAQDGKKVVIVDTNIRSPKIHTLVGLSNEVGLSNILIQNADLDEGIQDTAFTDLKVICSGPTLPDPSLLLNGSQMTDLHKKLKADWDLVLYDIPPILDYSEAETIASLVDEVVLIAEKGSSNKQALQNTTTHLNNMKVKSFNLVINQPKLTRNIQGRVNKKKNFEKPISNSIETNKVIT